MTEKLYDADSGMREFSARVLSCEAQKKGWTVVLDRTAFFPEGGGQPGDTGTLGGVRVTDTRIKDGIIYHYTESPLEQDTSVTGVIDWEQRFRRMQNHSGEHIVSGTIHRLFGYNNVGFHMGSEDVTIDIDGPMTEENIREVERLANRTVCENVSIIARYPDGEELKTLEYRSKLDLTENVRIVTIEGCDMCACCAPHVARTGEIGIIKLLDFGSYKGGVRIHMLCGYDALEDYERRCDATRRLSALLSAKQGEVAEAAERLAGELSACKQELARLRKTYIDMRAKEIAPTDGDICIVEQDLTREDMQRLADAAADKCGGLCAVFSGSDAAGYSYVIVSRHDDLTALRGRINELLKGKGGGSKEMLSGKAGCTRSEAEAMPSLLRQQ
ncbi:MAG: hypothetical protein E7559_04870 [Ruminococcaceae bacterium]|nr:hypothetical protein [Oscillospiraceae bacterium]